MADSSKSKHKVDDAKDFYILIHDVEDKREDGFRDKTRVLAFWCFNAGVAFK